jgi:prepilin-type N-terminal cleavage/methylation domain-containing protein
MSVDIKHQGGFTIIEVLIALVLLTMLISISLEITLYSNQANEKSQAYGEANNQVFSKLQEYELRDFNDIPNGSGLSDYEIEDFSDEAENNSDNLLRDVEATVHSQGISGSLKKLTAKITYTHDGEERLIEYATYIQIDGVGR